MLNERRNIFFLKGLCINKCLLVYLIQPYQRVQYYNCFVVVFFFTLFQVISITILQSGDTPHDFVVAERIVQTKSLKRENLPQNGILHFVFRLSQSSEIPWES